MRFRPRYSLLTLLVLTALVAGGVKLWRGPHRVDLPALPSAEQQRILDRLIYYQGLKDEYGPATTELEYLQQWDERVYLGVKLSSTGSRPIPVIASILKPQLRTIPYRNAGATPAQLAHEIEQAALEHVVCWLYSPKFTRQVSGSYFDPKKKGVQYDSSTNWAYFLTSRKQLYLFHGMMQNEGFILKPLELQDLEDPEFRDFVAAELSKIPTR